ncbi:MAG: DUF2213 domain-containing protein [Clostridia bacterium]|nr:DUF2213 domain-containing protein [Clostridia bacterium]
MLHYYGTRLSENISRREPEGYLLCLNVPVARTGIQEYTNSELRIQNSELSPVGGNELIPVFRPEEEVFSPETVASFEGMPVTNDHPPEGVDVSNIRALQKGHAHNVRRGSGEESDLLLADLIITDPALITAILEEGKREISCGYTYELCRENGQYIQRKIRGNHVAVVDAGRAGSRVSIKDRKPVIERRKNVMKKSLSKVLARMAKDGDIETVAEIIEEMIDPPETENETAPAVGGESTVVVEAPAEEPAEEFQPEETKNIIIDESGLTGVLERLDRIIALLETAGTNSAADEDAEEAVSEAMEQAALETGDPAAEEIAAVMEEILDPVASVILEQEEETETGLPETLQTGDALRAALTAVKPVLARMPGGMRKKVAGDIAARLRRTGDSGVNRSDVYAALASAQRRTAPVSADLGRRIMEKRNASYKEGNRRG